MIKKWKQKLSVLSIMFLVFGGIGISAAHDSYQVVVPGWGGWTPPSKALVKANTSGNGWMNHFSGSWLNNYGDFTQGGTSTRVSDGYYVLGNTPNMSAGANKAIYYKAGYATKGRPVSSRVSSSNTEPNANTSVVSWTPDN